MVSWGGSWVEPMPDSIFPLDGLNQQLVEHVTSTGSSANTTNTYTHTHIYTMKSAFTYLLIILNYPTHSPLI